jgi:hypothetical protein
VLLTATFVLPDWSTGPKPTWLILFLVPFYAFELGMRPSALLSALGLADVYLFHWIQGTPPWNLATFLNTIGLLIFIFCIGLNTDKLNRIAYFDMLTKLPNRQMFSIRLHALLSGPHRDSGLSGVCSLTWINSNTSTIRWAMPQGTNY